MRYRYLWVCTRCGLGIARSDVRPDPGGLVCWDCSHRRSVVEGTAPVRVETSGLAYATGCNAGRR